jgi:hypothetical protein
MSSFHEANTLKEEVYLFLLSQILLLRTFDAAHFLALLFDFLGYLLNLLIWV